MIDSRYYIKTLNATESGESNTNDSYLLIPKSSNAKEFFAETTSQLYFDAVDCESGKVFRLRFEVTTRGEQRIYMLGAYCRENGIHAGDNICLERRIVDGEKSFFISFHKHESILLLQKIQGLYVVERNDLGRDIDNSLITIDNNGIEYQLLLTFDHTGSKRQDSPDEFDFYSATIDGGKSLNDIVSDKYVIIDYEKGRIIPFVKLNEYSLTQE